MATTKKCTSCLRTKSLGEFYPDDRRNGRRQPCKACTAIKAKVRRNALPPRAKPHNLRHRFEKFINKTDGCWYWTGPTRPSDGVIMIRVRRKMVYAYRLSYELYIGPIPDGMNVVRICDEKPCVNPSHLSLALDSEIGQLGGDNGRALLTDDDVRRIRRLFVLDGVSYSALAKLYPNKKGTFHSIVNFHTWKHVPLDFTFGERILHFYKHLKISMSELWRLAKYLTH